jgi:hypothetical protein
MAQEIDQNLRQIHGGSFDTSVSIQNLIDDGTEPEFTF